MLKRLYKWVLQWSEHPQAVWALFWLAVAESSFFPIPPDVLLIAMCLALPKRSFVFASVCTVASVLGGGIGYLLGSSFMDWVGHPLLEWYGVADQFDRLRDLYARYDAWIVIISGFTPIPYKVFTITAGACSIHIGVFFIASVLGRGSRFFLVGGLIYKFGDRARGFIEKHFNWVTLVLAILLVGGFVLIRWFL